MSIWFSANLNEFNPCQLKDCRRDELLRNRSLDILALCKSDYYYYYYYCLNHKNVLLFLLLMQVSKMIQEKVR